MIKVKISNVGTNFHSLEVKGHAGSGPYGHDLACAAVSAITFGGLNALESGQNSYDVKIQKFVLSLNFSNVSSLSLLTSVTSPEMKKVSVLYDGIL